MTSDFSIDDLRLIKTTVTIAMNREYWLDP